MTLTLALNLVAKIFFKKVQYSKSSTKYRKYEVTTQSFTSDTREKRLRMLVGCMKMSRIRHRAIVNICKFRFHTCFNNGLHKMPKRRVSS
jgi:hypothetical protein